jgi:hypothetical protein
LARAAASRIKHRKGNNDGSARSGRTRGEVGAVCDRISFRGAVPRSLASSRLPAKAAQTAERISRMKMFVAVVFAFALLVNVSGCGSKLKGEAEVQEILNLKKEALKDPAKAMELLPKVLTAMKKLEDLKLTPDEIKKLEEKYPELKDKKDDKK